MGREERHSHSEAESGSPQAHAAKRPQDRSEDKTSQSKAWTLKEFSGKTVWDWLQLLGVLAIPLVIGIGGCMFNVQQDKQAQKIENQRAKAERDLAEQRAQDEALQDYLNQMSSLLEKGLRNSDEGSELRTLARSRTLTVLSRLDPSRKTEVAKFLVEAALVQSVEGSPPIVSLFGANLRGANLTYAELSGANLGYANLNEADLSYADLSYANLNNANLNTASLSAANVGYANLSYADLSGAKLSKAYLTEALVTGVKGVSKQSLEKLTAPPVTVRPPSKPGDIFRDDFSNNNMKWIRDEYFKNTQYYYVAGYSHGAYRIYNAPSDPPYSSVAHVLQSSIGKHEDMIVEVDAQVSGDAPHGTDTWGIICRFQDFENFYVLKIGPAGYSDIYKRVDNKWQRLASDSKDDAIRGGTEQNHLRADCLGNKLTLFVNGHKVVEAEDSTFDSGTVGLYMGDDGEHKSEVVFDNFLISSP
jgi:uncharacterized protein YjbI with pentapeptide repeats